MRLNNRAVIALALFNAGYTITIGSKDNILITLKYEADLKNIRKTLEGLKYTIQLNSDSTIAIVSPSTFSSIALVF